MIKQGDRVRVLSAMLVRVVCGTTPRGVLVRLDANELELRYEDVELLCGHFDEFENASTCPRGAELFVRATGTPVCPVHARKFLPPDLADTRVEPSALVSCACGASLDRAKSQGIWTLSLIACEYRQCAHCGSSRPWMPADVVPGREIGCYPDPHSSEVEGGWDSLLDALQSCPPNERATLIRNGVTLARAFVSPDDRSLGWHVQKPERETA